MRASCIAMLMMLAAAAAAAQPGASVAGAPAGASSCSGCHAGAAAAAAPSLKGRSAADIVTAMRAFRAGELSPTVMDRIAKGFSEEESQAIAAWLAAQP